MQMKQTQKLSEIASFECDLFSTTQIVCDVSVNRAHNSFFRFCLNLIDIVHKQ